MAPATAETSVGRRTTTPGLPVDHRLAGPPGVAGHLGHPGGGGLEEDDAEPLLLEAEPPVAAEHGEDVGRADQRGAGPRRRRPRAGGPARRCSAIRPASRSRSRPRPAMATVRSGNRRAEPDGGVDQHVHPLAGHQAADAHHQGPVGREAQVGPGRRPARARRAGRKRSRSTPGGIVDHRRHPASPQRPGWPRRPGSRRPRRPARCGGATWARASRLPGSRPGTATSAPWSSTA